MKRIYSIALAGVLGILLSCNAKNEAKQAPSALATSDVQLKDYKPTAGANNGFANSIAADNAADSTANWQQEQEPAPGDKQKQLQQQKQSPSSPAPKTDWDKKIIKNATLNAEVKDFGKFNTSLREKVKGLGGYVAEEQQSQSEYKIENTIVIKVPVDQFDEALTQLTSNTEKINQKQITSMDVTTEVVDTKSRMEAKKQVRSRYIDLLKQAKNMEEVLSVQNEINGIQEDIESAAGRIGYLEHSSSYSTINLTYFQVLDAAAKGDNEPSFGTKLAASFRSGGEWIADLFVGLVTLWPLFLVIGAAIIVYKRTRQPRTKQA